MYQPPLAHHSGTQSLVHIHINMHVSIYVRMYIKHYL